MTSASEDFFLFVFPRSLSEDLVFTLRLQGVKRAPQNSLSLNHKQVISTLNVFFLSFSSALMKVWGFPDSSVGKESGYNAGDPGLIPGLGRSAGEGISYPLQYSWEYSMGTLAWLRQEVGWGWLAIYSERRVERVGESGRHMQEKPQRGISKTLASQHHQPSPSCSK